MNRMIPKTGAAIVAATVFLFAAFLIADFSFGSYLVCMILPIGYVMTAVGFYHESDKKRREAAAVGVVFAAVYATIILLVYFAQTTSVRLEALNDQAARLLDYRRCGLLFNYDLLGYGIMALSTFFIGLSLKADRKSDRALRYLLMIHGVFFLSCFILPMTGAFAGAADGDPGKGGTIALLIWCAYFFPVGVLAFRHFKKAK